MVGFIETIGVGSVEQGDAGIECGEKDGDGALVTPDLSVPIGGWSRVACIRGRAWSAS